MNFKKFLNEEEMDKNRWEQYQTTNSMLAGGVDILKQITNHGYKAFIVGGSVRDIILGKSPKDVDIATNSPISELQKIFPKNYDIGKSKDFGIIAVKHKGHTYEIANFRKDGTYSNGRSPDEVKIVQDFKTDAGRRDFTMNAMGIDAEGHIIDHFDGLKDIKDKIIRTVGNPHDRFKEDNLRMMRVARFSSKLGFKIDKETKKAIEANKEGITKVSPERIREELMKMASQTGDKFADALQILDEVGILKIILPEIVKMKEFEHSKEDHPEGGVWQHTMEALKKNKVEDPLVNFAILLHDIGKTKTHKIIGGKHTYHHHPEEGVEIVNDIASKLKLSNDEKDAILFAMVNHMKFGNLFELRNSKLLAMVKNKNFNILKATTYADAASRQHLFDPKEWEAALKKVAEVEEKWGDVTAEKVGKLISGERVMKLTGLKPSRQVGEIIKNVTDYILQHDIKDEKEIDELIMKEYKKGI